MSTTNVISLRSRQPLTADELSRHRRTARATGSHPQAAARTADRVLVVQRALRSGPAPAEADVWTAALTMGARSIVDLLAPGPGEGAIAVMLVEHLEEGRLTTVEDVLAWVAGGGGELDIYRAEGA